MASSKGKIHFVIVSYTFPPSKEIGGRRWAKFSQQLHKKGHEVSVVCSNDDFKKDWYEEEFSGINIVALPKYYPEWLSGFTSTIWEKIRYRFYTRIFSVFTKQNLFDRAYAWKKPMLTALEKIQTANPIDVLVVTGAPFSILYYGALFKLKYPKINLVSDFRDPWTWGGYYGIPNLKGWKKKFQKDSEQICIEQSDLVCYPTEHMGNQLKSMYPRYVSKMYLLPHAFDPDKFSKLNSDKRSGFIYGGSLYPGIEEYLKKIISVVEKNPVAGFTWDIYTGSSYPLLETNNANGAISKLQFIPEEKLFERIQQSAAYLAVFPETDKDLISTKFFEIINTNTPILYIGEEGDVSKFIRENKLGVHILPKNIESELPKYLSANIPFEPGYFDVSQYTFSKDYRSIFKNSKHNC